MHDFLKEIDLNPPPALGGPIVNPLDGRAMHYFGFKSDGQEIALTPPTSGGIPRILVSWHYANQPTLTSPPVPPPIDAIVDFGAGPPVLRYDENHERPHAIVWLDPSSPLPPPGTPVVVRIRAWAKV